MRPESRYRQGEAGAASAAAVNERTRSIAKAVLVGAALGALTLVARYAPWPDPSDRRSGSVSSASADAAAPPAPAAVDASVDAPFDATLDGDGEVDPIGDAAIAADVIDGGQDETRAALSIAAPRGPLATR